MFPDNEVPLLKFLVNKKEVLASLISSLVIASLGIGLSNATHHGPAFYGTRNLLGKGGVRRGPATYGVKHSDSGSVVSNGFECAAIGGKILQQMKGNVADAAVATMFCEGIAVPQSCGLGGGFFLTIYTKSTGKVETLNAREMAPKAATEDMFVGVEKVTGIRSTAVPSELKGIWELHQRYGSLPWRKLIEPSIDLCRNGHVVSRYFADVLKLVESTVRSEASLAEVFINPKTNAVWIEGDVIKRPKLAKTLELIAKEGADTLYNNGTLSQMLVNEIQELGGIITTEDFMDYAVRWEDSISTKFLDNTIHTAPPPASGSVLILILNILNGFLPSARNLTFYQRFVESFKFAYAKRTELADYHFYPKAYETFQQILDLEYARDIRSKIEDDRTYQDYEHYGGEFSLPEDHGTAHISVIAPNGDAISVTTTINTIFGSKVRSRTTGIILNDEMDDFSTPGVVNAFGVPSSPANYIAPGKRPLSSMCPAIVIDKCGDVKLVIGGAGGTRITTAVAYTIVSKLMFNEPLSVPLTEKRFHHQLAPMHIDYEVGFNETILEGLIGIGHKVQIATAPFGFVAVTAIAREGKKLIPAYDNRRRGSTFVF